MILGIDPGKHHTGMCLYDPTTETILSWGLYAIDDITVETFIKSFRSILESVFEGRTGLDTVYIERQPPKNTSMCKICHYMHMYLAMMYPNVSIVLVPPARRINYLRKASPDLPFDTYSQRKKSSIQYVSAWLKEHNSSWAGWFHDQSKQDDCAESFLLCRLS